MKVTGITGGVGAGKSTLLSILSDMDGCLCVQADKVAREVTCKGGIAYEKIVFLFGEDILAEDGEIDRGKLGDIVFKEDNKRLVLNSIIHPSVKNFFLDDIERKREEGVRHYFIEAALLLDDHYEKFCDAVWYVYANEALRRERLKLSRGYTDEKIDGIFNSQMTDEYIRRKYIPDEERRPFSDAKLFANPFVTRYDTRPPWIVFDNSEGLFLTPEFLEVLDRLMNL